jgi:peptide/nickel transport system permease protein
MAGAPATSASSARATASGRAGVARRLARQHGAVVGLLILAALAGLALGAPWLSPRDPIRTAPRDALQPPGARYLLGSDQFGRDVASRVLRGARISLTVGLISVSIALALGAPVGLLSGYYGGRLDAFVMRVMDVLLAFPGILLAIAVMAALGPSLPNVMIAVGIRSIPSFARLTRGMVLTLTELEFVQGAHALGAGHPRVLLAHILPNAVSPLLVFSSMQVATAILLAAILSFLGLGVQPPTPEWGKMISDGRAYLLEAPHVSLFPGLAIFLTVMGFNCLGDGLRDALDPRVRVKAAE